MIDPLAAFSLPRQRLSMQALVTVGALHVALLWLILQSGSALQATPRVVIQYFSPITQLREKPAPQPVRTATPTPKPIPVVPVPVPRVETPPPPVLVEQAPVPIIQKLEAVAPQRATVKIQDIKPQIDTRRLPDVSSSRIEPVLSPVPVLATPEPLPVPKPPPLPVPEPIPPPVQTPPAPPVPEPVVPPVPAPAPQPAAAPEPAPVPAPARATAITPVETRVTPVGAATGSTSSSVPQSTQGVVPAGSGLNLNYTQKPDNRSRQRSAAEMANEQLNGTGRRDKLAQGMSASEKPDCINSGQALGLLAPIAIAYNVVKDKCK